MARAEPALDDLRVGETGELGQVLVLGQRPRALRVARALETGVLSVNSNSSVRVQTPFGEFKQSGFGRELGLQAMDGYSEVKMVFISTEG
jgi:acyl-CoA reductase-like NAD-dependent aldehyde dehydrogenase